MTHYWAFVVFLAALAMCAAAADFDENRRRRYQELDDAPDVCRGAQPDRTPEMRTAPTHSAKNTVGADRIHPMKENRS